VKDKVFLISRTDSIGDVVLTLPICAWLKANIPNCKIIFLGNTYTKPILACYPSIDLILEWKELAAKPKEEQLEILKQLNIDCCIHVFPNKEIARLAKMANIPIRIGTSHRLFHWTTCTVRPNFTRKKSPLHESQLNFELLKPLGLKEIPSLSEISSFYQGFKPQEAALTVDFPTTKKIILHPKSQGSALEWPIEKYIDLANKLVVKQWTVYFTGTEKEGLLFSHLLPKSDFIIDMTGKFSLTEFIAFIAKVDAIVACSTGPLHIGAVLGLKAIGLYSQTRPIHPDRWKPIGKNAIYIVNESEPKEGKISPKFIQEITVESVLKELV
jgi:ADP-heptose:LPS heptosyltransferase